MMIGVQAVIDGYGIIGLGVALLFLAVGVDRVEPSARGSYFFRVLVLPGAVLLWPLVLIRWLQLEWRGGGR